MRKPEIREVVPKVYARHYEIEIRVVQRRLALVLVGVFEIRFQVALSPFAPERAFEQVRLGSVGVMAAIDLRALDRPELVFQSAPNIFEVPIDHRWTGRLSDNVTRVLASNLARRLPRTSVLTSTPAGASVRTLAVEIHQFHSVSGGDASLHATATISGATSRTRTYSLTQPLAGDGYAALTAAQSTLLAQLAKAITTDLL